MLKINVVKSNQLPWKSTIYSTNKADTIKTNMQSQNLTVNDSKKLYDLYVIMLWWWLYRR